MSKHTPGPWKAGRADMATLVDGVDSKWVYAGDQYVAVASGNINGDWSEVMANARLIASAPNMLEMLKELEFVLEDENGDAVLCPVCVQRQKHAETCELGKLLREVES